MEKSKILLICIPPHIVEEIKQKINVELIVVNTYEEAKFYINDYDFLKDIDYIIVNYIVKPGNGIECMIDLLEFTSNELLQINEHSVSQLCKDVFENLKIYLENVEYPAGYQILDSIDTEMQKHDDDVNLFYAVFFDPSSFSNEDEKVDIRCILSELHLTVEWFIRARELILDLDWIYNNNY